MLEMVLCFAMKTGLAVGLGLGLADAVMEPHSVRNPGKWFVLLGRMDVGVV